MRMRSRGSVDMQRIPVMPIVYITMMVRGCQADTRHSIVLLSLVRFIASRVFNNNYHNIPRRSSSLSFPISTRVGTSYAQRIAPAQRDK